MSRYRRALRPCLACFSRARIITVLPGQALVTASLVTFVDQHFSSILNGFALGMLLFILAVGLSLIFGLLDVLNLAHGSLYLLGTYVGFQLAEREGVGFIPAALAVAAL